MTTHFYTLDEKYAIKTYKNLSFKETLKIFENGALTTDMIYLPSTLFEKVFFIYCFFLKTKKKLDFYDFLCFEIIYFNIKNERSEYLKKHSNIIKYIAEFFLKSLSLNDYSDKEKKKIIKNVAIILKKI